jgi:hypothetical protein
MSPSSVRTEILTTIFELSTPPRIDGRNLICPGAPHARCLDTILDPFRMVETAKRARHAAGHPSTCG